jgi:hypothetical protein
MLLAAERPACLPEMLINVSGLSIQTGGATRVAIMTHRKVRR